MPESAEEETGHAAQDTGGGDAVLLTLRVLGLRSGHALQYAREMNPDIEPNSWLLGTHEACKGDPEYQKLQERHHGPLKPRVSNDFKPRALGVLREAEPPKP